LFEKLSFLEAGIAALNSLRFQRNDCARPSGSYRAAKKVASLLVPDQRARGVIRLRPPHQKPDPIG
jgi:hypothetical protein